MYWGLRVKVTDAGVSSENVPVKYVEGEVSEAPRDLTVEVLPIERTGGTHTGRTLIESLLT